MPIISNLIYTVTDTTIVATWTTDTSSDSNLTAGGKSAVDNGLAANSTSHQCIVVGLSPSTQYSCIVTSGGSSSSPQNVTTSTSVVRTPINTVQFSGTVTSTTVTGGGDSVTDFVSNDNISYNIMNDGTGWAPGNAGAGMQVDNLSSEVAPLGGSTVNLLTAYGGNGSTNKVFGIIGFNGNLYISPAQQAATSDTFGNFIQSQDHGATWDSFQAPNTYTSTGTLPSPLSTLFFDNSNIGCVMFVRYAMDDGTMGYNTAGNQIDGANAFIYGSYHTTGYLNNNSFFMLRIPRISLLSLDKTKVQYWHGSSSPTPADFVNDSNWTSSSTGATACYTNTGKVSWGHIIFIPGLNRYFTINWYYPSGTVLSSQSVWFPMEAPTPAGPWTVITNRTNDQSGWFSPSVMHRTAATNTAISNIPLNIVYSGTNAGPNGVNYYHATISGITLNPSSKSYVTPAVVNFPTPGGTSGSVTNISTGTFSSTTGNTLVAGIRGGTTTLGTITSVKNAAGVSLIRITAADALQGVGQATIMYYLQNITGNASDKITVTFSSGVTFTAVCCWEVSGVSALDSASFGTSVSATSLTSQPFANSQAASIVFFIGGMGQVNNTYSFPGIPAGAVVDSAGFPAGAGNQYVGAGHMLLNSQVSTGITVQETAAAGAASISVAAFIPNLSSNGSGTQDDMLNITRWCSRMWP